MELESNSERFDPDPWMVVNLVLLVLGTAGTMIQAGVAYRDRKTIPVGRIAHSFTESFQECLQKAIRSTEKIIRFLASRDLGTKEPLSLPFRYGEVALLMTSEDLTEFSSISSALSFELSQIQSTLFSIIRYNPEAANRIGTEFLREVNDFKGRLNAFYKGEYSNGQVLDDALMMLRTFERTLGRMQGN